MRYYIKTKPEGNIYVAKESGQMLVPEFTEVTQATYYQNRYTDGYDDGEDFKTLTETRYKELLDAQYTVEVQLEIFREFATGSGDRFSAYTQFVHECMSQANEECQAFITEVSTELDPTAYYVNIDTDDTFNLIDEADAILICTLDMTGEAVDAVALKSAKEKLEKKSRNKNYTSAPVQGAEYNPNQSYIKGDTCTGSDGVLYTAKRYTKGDDPTTSPDDWEGNAVIPQWDDPKHVVGVTYFLKGVDAVIWEDKVYDCIQSHTMSSMNYPTSQSGKKVWDVKK